MRCDVWLASRIQADDGCETTADGLRVVVNLVSSVGSHRRIRSEIKCHLLNSPRSLFGSPLGVLWGHVPLAICSAHSVQRGKVGRSGGELDAVAVDASWRCCVSGKRYIPRMGSSRTRASYSKCVAQVPIRPGLLPQGHRPEYPLCFPGRCGRYSRGLRRA